MRLKSCTLIACVGGLAFAQPVFADAPTSNQPPANPPPASNQPPLTETGEPAPNPADVPPCPGEATTPPCPQPAPTAQAQPVAPTYYSEETQEEVPGMYSYAWYDPRLSTGVGVGISVGGGVAGFRDSLMRDTMSSSVSGLWNARLTIGTHIPLGLDLSYVGTAQDVNTFSGANNGTLIGSAAEGMLRWNLLPHYVVNPYLFGGVGWQHYDVTNVKFATADTGMKTSDNVFEVPMGAGIALRDMSGFTFDLRGAFRWVDTTDLLIDPRTGDRANLDTWEASANLGYEF